MQWCLLVWCGCVCIRAEVFAEVFAVVLPFFTSWTLIHSLGSTGIKCELSGNIRKWYGTPCSEESCDGCKRTPFGHVLNAPTCCCAVNSDEFWSIPNNAECNEPPLLSLAAAANIKNTSCCCSKLLHQIDITTDLQNVGILSINATGFSQNVQDAFLAVTANVPYIASRSLRDSIITIIQRYMYIQHNKYALLQSQQKQQTATTTTTTAKAAAVATSPALATSPITSLALAEC